MQTPPPFSLAGLRRGAALALPFGASSVVYGLAFGALAAEARLSLGESLAMSALVFSGTAQIAVLPLWHASLALAPIFATVVVMNARYILMGAALRPWLAGLSAGKTGLSLAFLVDGGFILASRRRSGGDHDVGVLLGAGLVSYTGWVLATGVGYELGRGIGDIRRLGLDFILVAFCASAVAMLWHPGRHVVPVAAAVVAALVIDGLGGGNWAIAGAGIAGAVAGGLMHDGRG
ncbi:MAG: AzlC family ABC transporter permease [Hyphomicrobiaceae bacterium]|nr:AzlC family ABC transporter permease [Hyphomicrobiaceae bacterium]